MDYVSLGKTGLRVSRLCLGAMSYGSSAWRPWVLDEEQARPFIRRAIELGFNFFDTADMYSGGASEQVLGRALRDFGPGRDRIVVATKVYMPMSSDPNHKGLSRKHIMHSIDDSLRRLGTTMQNYYNVVYREEEREMLPLCRAEGLGIIPFSPLARGFVAGNRRKQDLGDTVRAKTDEFSRWQYYHDADFSIVDRVTEIARKRGVPNAQVALAWVLDQPGITSPIIGATNLNYLDDAVAALELKLEEAELRSLIEPYRPRGVLANL